MRLDEADEWADRSAELGASDDVTTQMFWRQAKAKVLAQRREPTEAEKLAREALSLAEDTDAVTYHADALLTLGEVLSLAGRNEEASVEVERALTLYERKGNLVMAERARAQIEELRATTPEG